VQVGPQELLTAAGPGLVAEVLQRFGAVTIQVAGTSMLPAIRPRDLLLVQPRPFQKIRVADVVLFTVHDRLFAHRVVRTGVDDAGCLVLVTRGDTHGDDDKPIAPHQVLGQVVTMWRNGRPHQAPFAYSRTASLAWRAAAACMRTASRIRAISC
jgi:signal peptidase I